METFARHVVSFVLIAALLGYASGANAAGTDFARPDADTIRLGETTYAQVIAKWGTPKGENTQLVNERMVKTLTYQYDEIFGNPLHEGVRPTRLQYFWFSDDKLVGHRFDSSFANDHTDFDESKVEKIRKGQTTRDEVINLVGKPSGHILPPIIKTGDRFLYGITEIRIERGFLSTTQKIFEKRLILDFDDKDVVIDVQFGTSGSR